MPYKYKKSYKPKRRAPARAPPRPRPQMRSGFQISSRPIRRISRPYPNRFIGPIQRNQSRTKFWLDR